MLFSKSTKRDEYNDSSPLLTSRRYLYGK